MTSPPLNITEKGPVPEGRRDKRMEGLERGKGTKEKHVPE